MVDPDFSASSASKPAGADPVRDAFGLESRSRLTPLLHESKERAKLRRHRDILPDADRRGGTRIRRTPTRTCLIRFSAFIRVKTLSDPAPGSRLTPLLRRMRSRR